MLQLPGKGAIVGTVDLTFGTVADLASVAVDSSYI